MKQNQTMNNLPNLTLFLFLLLLLFTNPARSADPAAYSCDGNNRTDQISQNIDKLLPTLISGTIQNGFITASYGKSPAQIYGLAQCRGDVSKDNCSACIQDAARDRARCQAQSGARIWYDFCFLRYNTDNFFGQVETSGVILYNVVNVTNPDAFNKKLGHLMDDIRSEAVGPGSKGLGKGTRKLTTFSTLYGLVQCTRDLSSLGCAQCLATAIFPDVCLDKKGCRVLFGSCYVRYEVYPFFFPLDSDGSSARGAGQPRYVAVKKLD